MLETRMFGLSRRLALAFGIVAAGMPASVQSAAAQSGYWHDGWAWGSGHMMFGGLMMLLFLGGLIAAIVFIVRWVIGGNSSKESTAEKNKGLQILWERFARGEIEKEEFEERKRLLCE
jgi:putative membrane protein